MPWPASARLAPEYRRARLADQAFGAINRGTRAQVKRDDVHAVGSRDAAIAATVRLIAAARRDICLHTRALDPALLDSDDALEALKRIAIGRRNARIRILVREPMAAAQSGHRLIALAQRLTSIFELRTPAAEDAAYPGAFGINDAFGYFFRPSATRFEGETADAAPARHAPLQDYFDQVWARAAACAELRQLSL